MSSIRRSSDSLLTGTGQALAPPAPAAFSPAGAKKYDAIGAAQLLKPFFSLLYAANPAVVSGVAQIVFGLVVLLGARAAKALRITMVGFVVVSQDHAPFTSAGKAPL